MITKPAAYYDILHPKTGEMYNLKQELMKKLYDEAYKKACVDLDMAHLLEGVRSRKELQQQIEIEELQAKYARSEHMRQVAENRLSEYLAAPAEPISLHKAREGHAAKAELSKSKATQTEEPDHSATIQHTLIQYGLSGITVKDRIVGPSSTLYLLKLDGCKVSEIGARTEELRMRVGDVRVIGAIPGTGMVGVEVTNLERRPIILGDVHKTPKKKPLKVTVGVDSSNDPFSIDLSKMPHMIVAGATGGGKSGFINAVISSLLYQSPDDVKLAMIDLKRVELAPYRSVPHLWRDTAKTADDAVKMLSDVAALMDERYMDMEDKGFRSFDMYREDNDVPYIVVVADEVAELMGSDRKRVEPLLQRLAQLGRAAGVHVIAATQRPSVNVITGTIKANFPARVAFKTASKADSMVILDSVGAESLAGRGDALFSLGADTRRFQTAWVDDATISDIVRSTHA